MMKRRTLIASISSVALAGCMGFGNDQSQEESEPEFVEQENIPDEIKPIVPLTRDFKREINEYYPDSSVYVSSPSDNGSIGDESNQSDSDGSDPSIYMDYATSQENPESVKSELHQIAGLYIEVAKENGHDPVTFTIVTGEVQAVVPEVTATKRVNGELKKDAFHETIGVIRIDRSDTNTDN